MPCSEIGPDYVILAAIGLNCSKVMLFVDEKFMLDTDYQMLLKQ